MLLKIARAVALILVESDPKKWRKHLRRKNGKYTARGRCDPTTYGTMSAALLSYKKLTNCFRGWVMAMKSYDLCAWNQEINANQAAIMFRANDMMAHHVEPLIVPDCAKRLDKMHGTKDPLEATRGNVHECIGLEID